MLRDDLDKISQHHKREYASRLEELSHVKENTLKNETALKRRIAELESQVSWLVVVSC